MKPMSPHQVSNEALPSATLETLKALGILTAKGGASPKAARKVKQVAHFLNLITPALDDIFARHEHPVIVDAGAGKAALSLAIYDRWIRPNGRGRLIAIESRSSITQKVNMVTGHYPQLEMLSATILNAKLPERIHMTLALHACDQATDHAILQGLTATSDYFALVPCCQAELARLLKQANTTQQTNRALLPLWQGNLHRREFGAHYTNVLRQLVLSARGYAVTVTELIGWEHSLKNELILAKRVGRYNQKSRRALWELLEQIPVKPWLIEMLSSTLTIEESQSPSISKEL